MIQEVDKDSINYSFERLFTFISINRNRQRLDQVQGLRAYCASVGMDEDVQDYLFETCDEHFFDPGSVFVGTLLGLAVAEYMNKDKDEG